MTHEHRMLWPPDTVCKTSLAGEPWCGCGIGCEQIICSLQKFCMTAAASGLGQPLPSGAATLAAVLLRWYPG
jgi:hypothetical protein